VRSAWPPPSPRAGGGHAQRQGGEPRGCPARGGDGRGTPIRRWSGQARVGSGRGAANDPVTLPPVMAMVDGTPRVPTTENAGGCFQMLGAPGGVVHVSLNFEAGTGAWGAPLKKVVQLLAPPGAGTTNLSAPLIFPISAVPAEVAHPPAVLPRVAVTVTSSDVATPPVLKWSEGDLAAPLGAGHASGEDDRVGSRGLHDAGRGHDHEERQCGRGRDEKKFAYHLSPRFAYASCDTRSIGASVFPTATGPTHTPGALGPRSAWSGPPTRC
jgi:hypothetical protein